jgi:hypothetical protein
MAGSAEKGRKEVGLHRKGRNHLESKQIMMRRSGERRSVWRVVETLEKCEYAYKMGGYLYTAMNASAGTINPSIISKVSAKDRKKHSAPGVLDASFLPISPQIHMSCLLHSQNSQLWCQIIDGTTSS